MSASPCARIVPLFPRESPREDAMLEVDSAVAAAWRQLAAAVRGHVAGFLADAPDAPVVPVAPVAPVVPPAPPAPRAKILAPRDAPAAFAADLERGGPALRAAFPALRRRVAAIALHADRVVITIACEATHDGTFFGFMRPTRRAVQFTETHAMRVDGDRVVDDALAIDLRAIIRQLATPAERAPPPAR